MSPLLKPEQNQTPSTANGASRVSYATPLANIVETKDGYLLEAEMPGVNKEGLEITVDNGSLTILGRRAGYESKGELLHRESRDNDYRRVFELDPSIDAGRIGAKMENGVLQVTLPKAEAVKPRKITVG
jgi:HSP20 family protein